MRPTTGLDDLATTLMILRRRARMTQRDLGRLSGISYTQIGMIERAEGGHPSPLTLREIAKGLAIDPVDDQVDQRRADAFYRQLMTAAGYLKGIHDREAADGLSEQAVAEYLAARTGDEELSERLVQLAKRFPALPADEQTVVRHLVGQWVKRPSID